MIMDRTVKILLLVVLVAFGLNLWAQQKAGAKADGKGKSTSNILLPTVYLGKSDYSGGNIRKDDFDRLLKQGLTSRDSAGNKYKVMSFDFNYVERELYEDSIGNLKIMADVYFEYCPGDTISGNIAASIYDRVKAGDTIYVDRVKVAKYLNKSMKATDTLVIGAKGMKFVITK